MCIFGIFPKVNKKCILKRKKHRQGKYVCGGSREGFAYIIKPRITFNTLVWFHITAFIVLIYESLITFG